MTTNLNGRPGRPRKFDPRHGVETALRLFHAKGYDSVSVAEITEALGINTPSFYAAYHSKAGLFGQVLDLYARKSAIPLRDILKPDLPTADALADLLIEAARRYGANRNTPGCLALAAAQCADSDARQLAVANTAAMAEDIRRFVAIRYPTQARLLADYVSMMMAGLSRAANDGWSSRRLLAVANAAAAGVRSMLQGIQANRGT